MGGMNAVQIVLGIALLVMAVFLVVAVLMQSGSSKRLSGSIAGGAETFFGKNKGKTLDKMFSKLTNVVSIIFVIVVLATYYYSAPAKSDNSSSASSNASTSTSQSASAASGDASVAEKSEAASKAESEAPSEAASEAPSEVASEAESEASKAE